VSSWRNSKANACFRATMECFLNLESSAELGPTENATTDRLHAKDVLNPSLDDPTSLLTSCMALSRTAFVSH
jgi:hypothetical protein